MSEEAGNPRPVRPDACAFAGGPGRVTTPVEFEQIMQSLEQRLFTLPDETWVYPGHGDDTTIGAERPSIPDWRARGW